MNSENDLMQKLVVAKKIMDAHNKTPRVGNSGGIPSTPMLEQFNAPPAMYNKNKFKHNNNLNYLLKIKF